MKRLDLSLKVPVEVRKKGDAYVSNCPFLDILSQGDSREKAIENLRTAIRLFLMSCIERGTLDAVLKDCGFHLLKNERFGQLKSPKYLEIPIPFEAAENARSPQDKCHA